MDFCGLSKKNVLDTSPGIYIQKRPRSRKFFCLVLHTEEALTSQTMKLLRQFVNQADIIHHFHHCHYLYKTWQKNRAAKMGNKTIHSENQVNFLAEKQDGGVWESKPSAFLFVFVVGCSPLRWKQWLRLKLRTSSHHDPGQKKTTPWWNSSRIPPLTQTAVDSDKYIYSSTIVKYNVDSLVLIQTIFYSHYTISQSQIV